MYSPTAVSLVTCTRLEILEEPTPTYKLPIGSGPTYKSLTLLQQFDKL